MSAPFSVSLRLFVSILATVIAFAEQDARGQSTVIPLASRSDFVFDFTGNFLYISTTTGTVVPYNLNTNTLGTPFPLGGWLWGMDIARDNSYVLVAQNSVGVTQGTIHKLDLGTGVVTNFNYTLAPNERGAWDVAIGANGLALFTTQAIGASASEPARQINLTTNVVSLRPDWNFFPARGEIHRSADGTRLFVVDVTTSGGGAFTYSATSNTFGPYTNLGDFVGADRTGVNRDGSLVGVELNCCSPTLRTAPDLTSVRTIGGNYSALAFDAVSDTMYSVDYATDQIIAFDTGTGGERFRRSIGEDVPGIGKLVASNDGRYLALATPTGIRIITVPEPSCALLAMAGAATVAVRRKRQWLKGRRD